MPDPDLSTGLHSAPHELLLLDVRTVDEFNRGHMDGFRNIPVDELSERINEIEKGKPVSLIPVVAAVISNTLITELP